ncbi:DUF2752 domain-containing protein [Litorihabitans aurantiacus]|uniref:DUF2752 domain-containing protein n=1 Tax=Litorihabitans aurantiacus TaxID=1930061 RepID=A0AA37UHV3_9MICO|nr:DUF2752 domain-containing protein [Litorihabitans aurantiacus]GMA31128.1 hypothetical protein GCM10025875_11200 [Litorihabitans aurantiacus]
MIEPRPTPAATRRGRGAWSLPAGLAGVLLGGGALLAVRSPHVAGSYGVCPSAVLGFACPGCGGLRATHDLVHGDLAGAWAHNPLVVVGVAVALVLVVRWTRDAARGVTPWSPPTGAAVTVAVVLVLFTVARNIPVLTPFLGPLAVP